MEKKLIERVEVSKREITVVCDWIGASDLLTLIFLMMSSETKPEVLSLSCKDLLDEGIFSSSFLPFITGIGIPFLEISGCRIGISTCEAFGSNLRSSKIKSLKLTGTSISDAGVAQIASGLCHNTNLTQLSLDDNLIDDVGTIALAKSLAQNSSLTALSLQKNKFGFAGTLALSQLLRLPSCRISKLYLQGNSLGSPIMLTLSSALQYNCTLRELNLECTKLTAKDVTLLAFALKRNRVIRTLNLSRNAIGNSGVAELAALLANPASSVRSLCLRNTEVSEIGCRQLMEGIGQNFQLKALDISENPLGNQGAYAIAEMLLRNKGMLYFDMHSSTIATSGMFRLGNALQKNSSLTHLNASFNVCGSVTTLEWANTLHCNKTLISLSLENNEITAKGAVRLLMALRENMTLQHFSCEPQKDIYAFGKQPIQIKDCIQQIMSRNYNLWLNEESISCPSDFKNDENSELDDFLHEFEDDELNSTDRFEGGANPFSEISTSAETSHSFRNVALTGLTVNVGPRDDDVVELTPDIIALNQLQALASASPSTSFTSGLTQLSPKASEQKDSNPSPSLPALDGAKFHNA